MVKARSEYKSLVRKCKYNCDKEKEKTACFVNAKFKNAKMYRNILKEASGMKTGNIAMSTFEQYFKAVNNIIFNELNLNL